MDSASKLIQKSNILVFEESDQSYLVLGKDILGSIRGCSPDEGVSFEYTVSTNR